MRTEKTNRNGKYHVNARPSPGIDESMNGMDE
jgi:hypothetical protein